MWLPLPEKKKPSSVPCISIPKERWADGQERRVCNSFAGKIRLVKTGENLLENGNSKRR